MCTFCPLPGDFLNSNIPRSAIFRVQYRTLSLKNAIVIMPAETEEGPAVTV